MTNAKDIILLPCRHLCVCRACFVQLTLDKCPVCRAPFTSYLRFDADDIADGDGGAAAGGVAAGGAAASGSEASSGRGCGATELRAEGGGEAGGGEAGGRRRASGGAELQAEIV